MEKCAFIGYPEGYKGWKFYNPQTRKVIISERADYDERYNYSGAPLRSQVEKHIDPEPKSTSSEDPRQSITIIERTEEKQPAEEVIPDNIVAPDIEEDDAEPEQPLDPIA